MSCNLSIVKNFRISRTLFTKEDGSPTLFYSASPSDDLREIIEGGGGLLVTEDEFQKNSDHCIKLCNNRNDPEVKLGYLPLSYVKHCVMRNKLIAEQFYRESQLGQGQDQTSSPSEKVNLDSDDGSSGSNLMVCPQIVGRMKYTLAEDMKIIKYLINHQTYTHVGGNKIWKQMEALKITNHSYQSMKYRYLKSILPTIRQYEIPDAWISQLTMNYGRSTDEEEEEAYVMDDDEKEEDKFEGPQREFDEALETEAASDNCDESIIEEAEEKSIASRSSPRPGSKISERNEQIIQDDVNVTSQNHDEISTHATSEDDSSLESHGMMELFSVKTDNPSLTCKAKYPTFANSPSSLADDDDVDRWIVKEIMGKRAGHNQRPSISKAEVPADEGMLVVDVDELQRIESQHSPQEGEYFLDEDLASKDLTGHRIKAIMRRYNITQSEAAYLWLQHPDKFWTLI